MRRLRRCDFASAPPTVATTPPYRVDVEFETPTQLVRRLRLGREEFAQRLLTSLILHAPYPKWNTPNIPGDAGRRFLEQVHALSFPEAEPPGGTTYFVDEFELAPRHELERGGSPDYCVLWDAHLWMIELKTERASHRADQIPAYFDLARHHHPDREVSLSYLTPTGTRKFADPPWASYAHPHLGRCSSVDPIGVAGPHCTRAA